MNVTVGRGSKVHATDATRPLCGAGSRGASGRSGVTQTSEAVDCVKCIELSEPAKAVYLVTYQVNTLARGWVTKKVEIRGTEQWATKKIAELMDSSSYRVLSSEKIG